MKKMYTVLLVWILFLAIGTTSISANSGPPIVGITISPDVCEIDDNGAGSIFPGNLDILVRTKDMDSEDLGSMTDKYKEFYPFYEDIEYLDNLPTGWTSFSAYYQKENEWGNMTWVCGMEFGDDELVQEWDSVIVVYFDDEGKTLLMSEEIDIPNVHFYQNMDSVIFLNTTDNTIEHDIQPHTNPYMFLALIAILGLIIYSVIIELVVALVFRLKTKKALLNILLINIITQVIMYVYFFTIFDSHEGNYHLQLIIYEVLVLFIEFGYLHWRLKLEITPKRLALYVFVSNVVSYLLGIVRYY